MLSPSKSVGDNTSAKKQNRTNILVQEILILVNCGGTCKCLHLPLCTFPHPERQTWAQCQGGIYINARIRYTTADIPYLCWNNSKCPTHSFRLSRIYIGRPQKGPSHLGCSPDDNNSVYTLNHHHPILQWQLISDNDDSFYPKPLGSGGRVSKHLELHISVLVLVRQELVLKLWHETSLSSYKFTQHKVTWIWLVHKNYNLAKSAHQ